MKKVISIILSIIIIMSCFSFGVFAQNIKMISAKEALEEYEAETGEKVETYRYYFLMPNGTNGNKGEDSYIDGTDELIDVGHYAESWYNEYTQKAGIYWWDSGVADPDGWPGYYMEKTVSDSVFYADVPQEVTTIIFSNAIDGGTDPENSLYFLAQQTVNVPCEYYDPGESPNYPNGTESFDDMIFVVDPDCISVSDLNAKSTYGGEWYYYYGNGCYGTVKNSNEHDCIRDDHDHTLKSAKEALSEYEAQTGEKVETNRYYFLMPNGENGELGDDLSVDENGNPLGNYGKYENSWYNGYTDKAGIYWWDSGVADPERWPGYYMETGDSDSVFYADVPKDVATVIFNNAVNGGYEKDSPVFDAAKQTINVPCEYYDPGESPNYPNGTESFDDMIFVVDPDCISVSDLNAKSTYGGEWYYYYGDGCYGFEKDGNYKDCLRDDHDHSTNPVLNTGDVDGDGVVSVLDATAIQRNIAKIEKLTSNQIIKADFDNDGYATIMDATLIQFKIAKID